MVLLLDTKDLPARDCFDAFDATLNSAVFPSQVTLLADVPQPHARLERWQLGHGVDLVQSITTGHHLHRTPAQIRKAAPEQLSLAMVISGTITLDQGARHDEATHTVHSVEALSPYRAVFHANEAGPSVAMCAQVDVDRLGLSIETVRAALPHVTTSPVYELFRQHLAALVPAAAAVETTSAAGLLGSATGELARALIASAIPDGRVAAESLDATLVARIDVYIAENLSDRSLCADRIATAHHISRRHLYRLFAERERSLEQHIIHIRLEQARRELATQSTRDRPIEAIAYRTGFAHPQFFSRRFREAYGMTPREWRQLHTRAGNDVHGHDLAGSSTALHVGRS